MKIIDAHAHIFPEKIASAAVAATNHFYADAVSDHGNDVVEHALEQIRE